MFGRTIISTEVEGMTIKEMRELLNLSQSQFGEKYKIQKHTLANWEQGLRQPPEYVMYLLERAVKEDYVRMTMDEIK